MNLKGLDGLGGCTALSKLHLNGCRFVEDFSPLAELTNLEVWHTIICPAPQ
jgi:hypothetical protein